MIRKWTIAVEIEENNVKITESMDCLTNYDKHAIISLLQQQLYSKDLPFKAEPCPK